MPYYSVPWTSQLVDMVVAMLSKHGAVDLINDLLNHIQSIGYGRRSTRPCKRSSSHRRRLQPSLLTFTHMISMYCSYGDVPSSLRVLNTIRERGMHPIDSGIYNWLIEAIC